MIGVNTIDSTAMTTSLQTGIRQEMTEAGLFSDGTSVKLVGKENFRLCQKYVDDMILVSNDEICAAIKECYEDTRSILEPAGALALGGLKKYLVQNPELKGGVYISVLSGANMNFDRLQFVAERARIGEGKEALLSIIIPESPGTYVARIPPAFIPAKCMTTNAFPQRIRLSELHSIIYPRNVRELSYRYWDDSEAHVYVGFDVNNGKEEVIEAIRECERRGWKALDISEDEVCAHYKLAAANYY